MNPVKALAVSAALLCMFSVSGCGGSKYESSITDFVKKECYFPDSFSKKDFKADEKNGIAYIDFTAKNGFGLEAQGRKYFEIRNDQFKEIDTSNIEAPILDDFYKKDPAHFVKCISSYKALKDKEHDAVYHSNLVSDKIDKINAYQHTVADYRILKRRGDEMNFYLKKFKDEYDAAPDVVKGYFKENAKIPYIKVTITDTGKGWKLNSEPADEYPN